MRYATGRQIEVGDAVLAGGMRGIVVCDFDNRHFAAGYEEWDCPDTKMTGGGRLSLGIMVDTEEAGLVHYDRESSNLELRLTAHD